MVGSRCARGRADLVKWDIWDGRRFVLLAVSLLMFETHAEAAENSSPSSLALVKAASGANPATMITAVPNYFSGELLRSSGGVFTDVLRDFPDILEDDALVRDYTAESGLNVVAKALTALKKGRFALAFVSRIYVCVADTSSDDLPLFSNTYPAAFSLNSESVGQDDPALRFWAPSYPNNSEGLRSSLGSCLLSAYPNGGAALGVDVNGTTVTSEANKGTLWGSYDEDLSRQSSPLNTVRFDRALLLDPRSFWNELSPEEGRATAVSINRASLSAFADTPEGVSTISWKDWGPEFVLRMFGITITEIQQLGVGVRRILREIESNTVPPPPRVATNTEIALAFTAVVTALTMGEIFHFRVKQDAKRRAGFFFAIIAALTLLDFVNLLPIIFLLVAEVAAARYIGTALAVSSTLVTRNERERDPQAFGIGTSVALGKVAITDARVELIAVLTGLGILLILAELARTTATVVLVLRRERKRSRAAHHISV